MDIACGKGEFLIRLAELYGISGVGVDLSPYCIRDCVANRRTRAPTSDIEFLEMDGAEYHPASSDRFDLTMCIGASWVYNGYRGTLQALRKMTKPHGLLMVGEAFWMKPPSDAYLQATGTRREQFGTHESNVHMGEEMGLTCIYTMVSNRDDWDYYETLKWWNVENYVHANPNDNDCHELLKRTKREKHIYLRWERETLGWAIYLYRNTDRTTK